MSLEEIIEYYSKAIEEKKETILKLEISWIEKEFTYSAEGLGKTIERDFFAERFEELKSLYRENIFHYGMVCEYSKENLVKYNFTNESHIKDLQSIHENERRREVFIVERARFYVKADLLKYLKGKIISYNRDLGSLPNGKELKPRSKKEELFTSLKEMFVDESKADYVLNELVNAGFISENQYLWKDRGKGHKIQIVTLLHILYEKGYYKKGAYTDKNLVNIAKHQFDVTITERTFQNNDQIIKRKFEFSFIKPSNQILIDI